MQPITDITIDWKARHIIKALEPTLRQHLGAAGVGRQFLTDLYWRLCRSLRASELDNSEELAEEPDLQRLALDVYLSAATHLEGCELTPALLSSVTRDIETLFRTETKSEQTTEGMRR